MIFFYLSNHKKQQNSMDSSNYDSSKRIPKYDPQILHDFVSEWNDGWVNITDPERGFLPMVWEDGLFLARHFTKQLFFLIVETW